jgi:dTDP-4-amino-4,6-dideoxygalactose transaminase
MIPFSKSWASAIDADYVQQALLSGKTSGEGEFVRRASEYLRAMFSAESVLLVPSCTLALEMSALLLDIQPNDEVIVPSFTFVSTVNAYVLRGAKPVFVDISPDTLCMDNQAIRSAITEHTKAIVPVHYAGNSSPMDELTQIAESHGVPIVEDNAHGLFASQSGRDLGTFGAMSTLSFHDTKNISCGEGGALVINDSKFVERAEILYHKGTNRSKFFRGMVDKYSWVDIGSSYTISNVPAAYLLAQLEQAEKIQARRHAIWNRYNTELADWCTTMNVQQHHTNETNQHPAHMYYMLFPDGAERDRFIATMKTLGVQCVFHYVPLHSSQMGSKFGYSSDQLPVTNRIAETLVRLPLHLHLSDDDVTTIIEAVRSFVVQS